MEFINRLIGALFRIVLMLTGLVFVAGLMLLAITALALSLLWSLITGKRHPVTMVWSRFRQTQDAVWRASQGARTRTETRAEGSSPDVRPTMWLMLRTSVRPGSSRRKTTEP